MSFSYVVFMERLQGLASHMTPIFSSMAINFFCDRHFLAALIFLGPQIILFAATQIYFIEIPYFWFMTHLQLQKLPIVLRLADQKKANQGPGPGIMTFSDEVLNKFLQMLIKIMLIMFLNVKLKFVNCQICIICIIYMH